MTNMDAAAGKWAAAIDATSHPVDLVPFNREDPPMQDPVRIAAAAARAAEVIQRNPFGIWAPDGLGDFICLACHRVSHWGRPDDHKPDCQWNDLLVALGHPAAHRGPPVP